MEEDEGFCMKRKFFFEDSPPSSMELASAREISLSVRNFITLDSVDLTLGKVTVLIGPQAEGKSLLAKLISFFYDSLLFCPYANEYKDIKGFIRKNFSTMFPKITWKDSEFRIDFSVSAYSILIYRKAGRLCVNFNKIFERDVKKMLVLKKARADNSSPTFLELNNDLYDDMPYPFKIRSIFIPASRQLYSYVKSENFIYSSNEDCEDATLPGFFHILSFCKLRWDRRSIEYKESFNKRISKVVKGKYERVNNSDFIVNYKGQRIPITLASSGQQESLPLFLPLQFSARNIIVEEPEAHLFPTAQKEITAQLAVEVNANTEKTLLITTHSPYILSTLNNLIAAHDVLDTEDEAKTAAMDKIVPRESWLAYEDVQCFFLEKGSVSSMMDDENRMIDFVKIDACSEKIMQEYGNILDILKTDEEVL